MALYHGKGGMATWNSTDIKHITSITLSSSGQMADDSEMGNSWRGFLYGLTDWTATITTLNADAEDTVAYLGASQDLGIELLDSDDIITGAAICTGVSEEQPVDGMGTVTLTFVCNDPDGFSYTGLS